MGSPDILVLGGGIVGLGCTWELRRRGWSVEILDAGHPGAASAASAGMLGPLAEAEKTGPFFTACRRSLELWDPWSEDLRSASGMDLDHDRSGSLLVEDDEPGRLQTLERLAKDVGEPHEWVPRAELRRQIPDLAPEVREALLLPREHRIDNRLVCRALGETLERAGVSVLPEHRVLRVHAGRDSVELEGDGWRRSAARLLVAGGAWSGGIEGIPSLPVRPIRGQMLRLAGIQWPWLGNLRGPHFYAVRRAGDRLLVGATVEDAGETAVTTPGGLRQLRNFCARLLPGVLGRPVEASWAGLRPGTPDGLPILGPMPGSRGAVWIATGHYRNGVLLAPWTSQALASALTESNAEALPKDFLPDRFLHPEDAPDAHHLAEMEDRLSAV